MTGQHCPECGCELGATLLTVDEEAQWDGLVSLFDQLGKARKVIQQELMTLMKAPGVRPTRTGLEAYWDQGEKPQFQGWQLLEDAALMPPGPERDWIEKLIAKYTKPKHRSYFNIRRATPPGVPVPTGDPFDF